MHSLEQTWQRVGFEEPHTVERWLVHGTVTGVAVGALGAMMGALAQRLEHGGFAVQFSVAFTAAMLTLVLPRQHFGIRLSVMMLSFLFMVLSLRSWTPAVLPYFFTVPLGLTLAFESKTRLRQLLAFAGPSLGAAWCLLLERWLSGRHLGPAATLGWLAMIGAGLFISAGAALSWLTFSVDAVEPKLVDQPKVRLAWLRLRTALGKLPRGAPRLALEALAHEGATRCVSARALRDELARSLDEQAERDSREAVKALRERLEETVDPELQSHLAQLLRVHQDTLEQLEGLHRKAARLEAREAAEAGWLETAAFSVELAPKSELGALELSSRLRGLLPRDCN